MSELVRHINGHQFTVLERYGGGDELVECQECLIRDVVTDDDGEYIASGCICHMEWLRKPTNGFRGVALRNGIGFAGRELIAVDDRGEVTDTVRVYDDDVPLFERLVSHGEWQRRDGDGEAEGES